MRRVLALLLGLLSSPAYAGQIDYFCIFSNAAAAQADPNVGVFWNVVSSAWDTSTVFPGVSVTTPQLSVNGVNTTSGFWIIVSRPTANAGLDANPACALKLDRDAGKVNGNFVLGAAIVGSNRTALTFQPMPHGSGYPRPLGK